MRIPKYLSPTSVMKFYEDREEFYLNYLADNRPPRIKQTPPMAMGSAFDAFVKCYISKKLGLGVFDDRRELFEKQVEVQNHDIVWEPAAEIFDEYRRCGALADLMLEIELADSQIRMEDTVEKEVHGIPMLGKPDLFFGINQVSVIIDWKVNGYYSKWGMSPAKGYIKRFDTGKTHKIYEYGLSSGIHINKAINMEQVDENWATQLAIYSWILGAKVGSKILCGIDQISFRSGKQCCSKHRVRIGEQFQLDLMTKIDSMWKIIFSNHIFDDMAKEESIARQESLDGLHAAFGTGDKNDDFYSQIAGR